MELILNTLMYTRSNFVAPLGRHPLSQTPIGGMTVMKRTVLALVAPPAAVARYGCVSCTAAPIGVFWLSSLSSIAYGLAGRFGSLGGQAVVAGHPAVADRSGLGALGHPRRGKRFAAREDSTQALVWRYREAWTRPIHSAQLRADH
jgi:hypothetical protein